MTLAQAVECSHYTQWGRGEGRQSLVAAPAIWAKGRERNSTCGIRKSAGKGRGHQTEWGGESTSRSVLTRPSHPLAMIPQDATSAHRSGHWQVKDALEPTLEHRAVTRLLSPQLLFSELHSGAQAPLLVCLKCLLPISAPFLIKISASEATAVVPGAAPGAG